MKKLTMDFNLRRTLTMFTVLSCLVVPFSITHAAAGCCSHHQGVSGCASTGFDQCKDGTVSPSCKCDGSTSKAANKTETTNKAATTQKPDTMSRVKQALQKLKPTPVAKSQKGCCRGHGGVSSCNKKTGYSMCKDKTASPNCTCK